MFHSSRRLPAIAVIVAALLAVAASSAPARAKAPKYSAKITRTSYGIPHIKASTWGSLGYGSGYVYAQDNLCTLAQEMVTVNAQRSRYFGPNGTTIASAMHADDNLESDFFWTSVKAAGTVERLVAQRAPLGPKPEVREMVAGYAAGYDAYLERTGVKHLPDPRCRGKAWVKPISATDLWRRYYQLAVLASSGQFIHEMNEAAPPSTARAAARQAVARSAPSASSIHTWFSRQLGDEHPQGSNGIGLGSQATKSGRGMILANPHFPWTGGERFYQFQLTLPGKMDVQGASVAGVPVVTIGFNKHVAWTHTVSTARRFTAFRLKLAPGNPRAYVYDGKTIPFTSRTVTVKVRTSTGLKSERHTFWYSKLGPVLDISAAGYGWDKAYAYALGDANANNMRIVNAWFDLGRAKSVDDLVSSESRNQGVPWVNTIGADDKGNAVYEDNTVVPAVSKAAIDGPCIPAGLPRTVYDAADVVTLDGSTSACGWAKQKGAVIPGIFAPKNLPVLKRKDYVQNSNDSYWLSNPDHPLTGFSPIIGSEDTRPDERTRYGVSMIKARLAGTDGLPGKGFTTSNLRQLWSRDVSGVALLVKDQLADLCQAHPTVVVDGSPVNVAAACPIIRAWDGTGRLDSKGAWLFQSWWGNGRNVFSDPFDKNDPLTTPHVLAAGEANITKLGEAVKALQDHGLPLDATNRQVQYAIDKGQKIPVPGCGSECYAAIYPVIEPGVASKDKGLPLAYGQVADGSSIVMQVELGKHGPSGQSILTYSESENPDSPHHGDQTRAFSKGRWIPLTFTAKQIAKDRKQVYTVK